MTSMAQHGAVIASRRRTRLRSLAPNTWHNIETEDGAADRAVAISGQQHIPVVLYPDGTFQVEPSAVDIKNKLNELNIK